MSIPKRLIGFVIVLIGVSILSFSLSAISGVDPAEAIARHQIFNASPELIERIREEYNLDRSIVERYFSWMSGILKGDFGISYMSHNAVRDDIASLLPKRSRSGLSLTLIIVVALPVGALCAQYHNGIFDQIMRWVTVFGSAFRYFGWDFCCS